MSSPERACSWKLAAPRRKPANRACSRRSGTASNRSPSRSAWRSSLGWLLARALRRAGLAWTWALLGLPVGYLAGGLLVGRWPIWFVSVIAAVKGSRLHDADVAAGGESAQIARSRDGVGALLSSWSLPAP